ncbi:MAG: hypothetical protein JWM98_2667, partial [Thermoleophilia bacterium]|nr:hypothetical protein [Thermoleophilia bacterium]
MTNDHSREPGATPATGRDARPGLAGPRLDLPRFSFAPAAPRATMPAPASVAARPTPLLGAPSG